MQLRDLLAVHGLAAEHVSVLCHVSPSAGLQRALPMLAQEEPALFDAFQNNHKPNVEAALKARPYVLSFVATTGRDYCLAGLFAVNGHQFRTNALLDADPRNRTLQERYEAGTFAALGAKPAGRAYALLAEKLDRPVVEMTRERRRVPPAPDWDCFIVTAAEVRRMPAAHATRLAEWRGVYLIVDEADGQRYVGSACGAQSLYGQCRAHSAGAYGVTVALGRRDRQSFGSRSCNCWRPVRTPPRCLQLRPVGKTVWRHGNGD